MLLAWPLLNSWKITFSREDVLLRDWVLLCLGRERCVWGCEIKWVIFTYWVNIAGVFYLKTNGIGVNHGWSSREMTLNYRVNKWNRSHIHTFIIYITLLFHFRNSPCTEELLLEFLQYYCATYVWSLFIFIFLGHYSIENCQCVFCSNSDNTFSVRIAELHFITPTILNKNNPHFAHIVLFILKC